MNRQRNLPDPNAVKGPKRKRADPRRSRPVPKCRVFASRCPQLDLHERYEVIEVIQRLRRPVPDRAPIKIERPLWPPKLSEAERREWFERKLFRL